LVVRTWAVLHAFLARRLGPAMFDALHAAIARLQQTPGLRAVALHARGSAFCAGLDMASFAAMGRGEGMPAHRLLATDRVAYPPVTRQ
jgi:enoyl-CoA hydratase/carnithine racemase